jgi:hypothetical protein
MRRSSMLLGLAMASLASVASAYGQTSLKTKFTGTWELALDKSDLKLSKLAGLTLAIDHPDKSTIHVVETAKPENGQEKRRDYTCSTMGRECDVSEGSQADKLSIYYDGPKLVVIERLGKDSDTVLKRIFELSEDGSTLSIQESQMVPPKNEADKLVFAKAAGTT